MSKVIIIVGPTATGKSDLAVELAKQFNGEVVNGDSIAVYRELNIGSAKISEEEMKGIKHHLVGYKETYEDYDVATFQLDARNAIDEILKEEKVPIVVGGTGLYIKALLYDYDFSQNSNPSIDYSAFSNEQLYEKLKAIDEKSALKIHPNNRKRVIRALEIAQSGQLKSEIEDAQQHKPVYDALLIGLNMEREHLRE